MDDKIHILAMAGEPSEPKPADDDREYLVRLRLVNGVPEFALVTDSRSFTVDGQKGWWIPRDPHRRLARGPNTRHHAIISAVVDVLAQSAAGLSPRLILKRLDQAGISIGKNKTAMLATVLNTEVRLPNARLVRLHWGIYALSAAELERRRQG